MTRVQVFLTFLLSYFFISTVHAQLTDRFNNGNFTDNPKWSGNTSSWIVNPSGQLQSNDTTKNKIFYLSTRSSASSSVSWEFFVRLAFNTSSANYADAYLIASDSNLSAANTTGYFVRLGNTDDDISLYRKDAGGKMLKIIDGINGSLNSANNVIKIKVIRTADKQWKLFRDNSGTGTNYVLEGISDDSIYTSSAFFGFLIRQSTASFFKKHFFDDIEVKPYTPDTTAPVINAVNVVASNSIDVLFSEPIDSLTAQMLKNFFVSKAVTNPSKAVRDNDNNALVHLTFPVSFIGNEIYTLSIANVRDISGNTLIKGSANFSFYAPKAFDIIIDEILSDPTPVVGLPNAEFIEIKNTSGKDIDLAGWKLSSLSTMSSPFPSYMLHADSFVILTKKSNIDSFSSFGKAIGISSFPSLNNSGTTLSLISKEGAVIHTVSYNSKWFQSDIKSDGGWTLEMLDTKNPCSGANNWKASTDVKGGTPGARNSVDGDNPDQTPPALLMASATDSTTLVLTFSETIDSAQASEITNYNLSNEINPRKAIALAPTFTKVKLELNKAVAREKVYTVTANNITDCSGNMIQAVKTTKFGLPSAIDTNDIVINEILFNPKPGAVDYVEIYNRSNKIFDLKTLFIANRSSTNSIASLRQITTDNILFFPGDYFVLSENGSAVRDNYFTKKPENFIDTDIPSLPNEEGTVVLLNEQKQVIDELHYSSQWHYALIDNQKGIALERIDCNKPTQDKENWSSAASTSGFGTPSYQNSQFRSDLSMKAKIDVTPKTISPNGDGFEDYTTINYHFDDHGYVANITIYNSFGRPVKQLAKNATLGLSGSFTWNGTDDKQDVVPVGFYVISTEVFNLNGRKKSFKNTVVVARRL